MTDQKILAAMLAELDISLPKECLGQLLRFRDELLRWNRRINLTAITDPEEALEKHLVDSLTLLPFLQETRTLLDIGSGGGFPAIPLKIALPNLNVWSVDASSKKITFQNHIARDLSLMGFTAWHARAEHLPDSRELPRFDMVVARAFSSIGNILFLSKPLLAEKGMVVAMKGPEATRELAEAAEDLEMTGMSCCRMHHLRLPVSGAERTLLFFVSEG